MESEIEGEGEREKQTRKKEGGRGETKRDRECPIGERKVGDRKRVRRSRRVKEGQEMRG